MSVWAVWKWHNKVVYGATYQIQAIRGEDQFPSIQQLSLLWIKNRNPKVGLDWNTWTSDLASVSIIRAN